MCARFELTLRIVQRLSNGLPKEKSTTNKKKENFLLIFLFVCYLFVTRKLVYCASICSWLKLNRTERIYPSEKFRRRFCSDERAATAAAHTVLCLCTMMMFKLKFVNAWMLFFAIFTHTLFSFCFHFFPSHLTPRSALVSYSVTHISLSLRERERPTLANASERYGVCALFDFGTCLFFSKLQAKNVRIF